MGLLYFLTVAAQIYVSDRLHFQDYTVHQARPNFIGPEPLLWAASCAACLNIITGGETNLLN